MLLVNRKRAKRGYIFCIWDRDPGHTIHLIAIRHEVNRQGGGLESRQSSSAGSIQSVGCIFLIIHTAFSASEAIAAHTHSGGKEAAQEPY